MRWPGTHTPTCLLTLHARHVKAPTPPSLWLYEPIVRVGGEGGRGGGDAPVLIYYCFDLSDGLKSSVSRLPCGFKRGGGGGQKCRLPGSQRILLYRLLWSFPQFQCHLKGQCHEIFCFWFFSWITFPQAPDNNTRIIISNFFENSRRYSQVKVHHRCQRHRWQICRRYQWHRRKFCHQFPLCCWHLWQICHRCQRYRRQKSRDTVPLISSLTGLKNVNGTVSRDFLLLVLFMNQFPPSPRVFH